MSETQPGDDGRQEPEAADEHVVLPDSGDADSETKEKQPADAPRRTPARDSEWGFLAADLERTRGHRARRGEEQVMEKARWQWRAALVAGAVMAITLAAVGCGGDAAPSGGERAAKATVSTLENGVLTVGSDIPFPPFEFRDGNEITGFDVELVDELARRLGLRVKWVDTAFDTLFTQVAAGRFDMAASATTITPERAKQVSFTEPYFAAQQALTVNTTRSAGIRAVAHLSGGDVVAVAKGTTGEAWARANLPDGVKIRSFPEAPDTYTALEAGAVTAVIMDEPSVITEVAKRKGLALPQTIDTAERYGFAVDPRNHGLLDALNRALGEIKQEGSYQRIYDRYDELPPRGSILTVEG
jgi:polar amino acid transport system substrate-binding protein